MAYDWEDAEEHTASSRCRSLGGVVRAGVSYALFAAGIAALASFFAPYVGLPGLAWHTGVLPTIPAPTEGERFVDVAPLIVGVVASALAVWLR